EDLPLAPRHPDRLARLALAHDHVEIPAEDQIRVAAPRADSVQDLVEGPDVAALADRAVDAEELERAPAGSSPGDLRSHHPTPEPSDRQGPRHQPAEQHGAAPAPRGRGRPQERVPGTDPEALAV